MLRGSFVHAECTGEVSRESPAPRAVNLHEALFHTEPKSHISEVLIAAN